MVLVTTFIIVIQSDSIIDLFKDYAAMQLISELDNMMFWLAVQGYVGTELATGAKRAKKIRVHDDSIQTVCGIPLRSIILIIVFFCMAGGGGKYQKLSGRCKVFSFLFAHSAIACLFPHRNHCLWPSFGAIL